MRLVTFLLLLLCGSGLNHRLLAQNKVLPPGVSNPPTEFLVAKETFNTKARPMLQQFLDAVQAALNGEEVDMTSIQGMFLDNGAESKIRVTNHKTELYDIYSVEDYFQHLASLRKQYRSVDIQFTIDEAPLKTSPLDQHWIAQIAFTQEFQGRGGSNYCDRTEKFVKLYIDQNDTSYRIYFGDIWFDETTKVDCAQ